MNGTYIPSCRVTSNEYRSPYMVMNKRSNTILDMADYRCGYFRLANDIFDPLLYNEYVRTDMTLVWVLELKGDLVHPQIMHTKYFIFMDRITYGQHRT